MNRRQQSVLLAEQWHIFSRSIEGGIPIVQSLLFEQSYWLVGLLVLIEYFLLVAWLRRRTSRLKWAVLIGLVVCVAIPLLQKFVTTDRERIAIVCEAIVHAVDTGDLAGIETHVSARFSAEAYDKKSFMAYVERSLGRHDVEDLKLTIKNVEINGETATVRIGVQFTSNSDYYQGPIPSIWELKFERDGEDWQLIYVRPIQIGTRKLSSLSELPG